MPPSDRRRRRRPVPGCPPRSTPRASARPAPVRAKRRQPAAGRRRAPPSRPAPRAPLVGRRPERREVGRRRTPTRRFESQSRRPRAGCPRSTRRSPTPTRVRSRLRLGFRGFRSFLKVSVRPASVHVSCAPRARAVEREQRSPRRARQQQLVRRQVRVRQLLARRHVPRGENRHVPAPAQDKQLGSQLWLTYAAARKKPAP